MNAGWLHLLGPITAFHSWLGIFIPRNNVVRYRDTITSSGQRKYNASQFVEGVPFMMVTGNASSEELAEPRKSREAALKSLQDAGYDIPESYSNLDGLSAPSPVSNRNESPIAHQQTLEETRSSSRQKLPRSESHTSRFSSRKTQNERAPSDGNYDIPDNYANLNELATPSPVENPGEEPTYRHTSLEDAKRRELEFQRRQRQDHETSIIPGGQTQTNKDETKGNPEVSRLATQLYTISYLILFSFLGTLARLGLQAITFYPGAPIVFSELWANVGGSLFMGFLSEDRKLFKQEWGTPTYHQQLEKAREQAKDEEAESGSDQVIDLQAAKKAHTATKKTIPLYIGLATGFCGCFTSFSSFIRDAFLALSNNLPTPLNHPADHIQNISSTTSTVPRNGGYSFMAVLAVIITTVALCISALHIGAHLAIALESYTPSIPFIFGRKVLDRVAVFLAWGCWLGAVFLAIFPPDHNSDGTEIWRGRAVFALVFAPIGCLGRFYASLYLNGKFLSFPLGTFVANVFGTAVLGMCYDLQHVPLGGMIGCQVLQGVEDGFCGCLTTVSTWVAELSSLRRRNAYRYGAVSVVVALCLLIVIMGSMQWTIGFEQLKCTH